MALEIQKDRFTISNDFISLTFLLQKGRLVSFALSNVLSGKTLTPERGDVFELRFAGAFGGETVRAGELKVQSALPAEDAAGFSMKVFVKPFRVRGCKTELQLCVALGKTDSFLKTWLQLHASGGEKAVLDYVDFAPFFVRAGEKLGGVPFPEKKKDAGRPDFLGPSRHGNPARRSLRLRYRGGRLAAGHRQRSSARNRAVLSGGKAAGPVQF